MTKAKTNNQLIKYGLGQDELLELVELELGRELDGIVNNIEWGGDEGTTDITFKDHHDRTWCVYYLERELEDTLFVHSYNGEDREEVNRKECKSITAVINHIKRVVGE